MTRFIPVEETVSNQTWIRKDDIVRFDFFYGYDEKSNPYVPKDRLPKLIIYASNNERWTIEGERAAVVFEELTRENEND